jgi:hypothetical protein
MNPGASPPLEASSTNFVCQARKSAQTSGILDAAAQRPQKSGFFAGLDRYSPDHQTPERRLPVIP